MKLFRSSSVKFFFSYIKIKYILCTHQSSGNSSSFSISDTNDISSNNFSIKKDSVDQNIINMVKKSGYKLEYDLFYIKEYFPPNNYNIDEQNSSETYDSAEHLSIIIESNRLYESKPYSITLYSKILTYLEKIYEKDQQFADKFIQLDLDINSFISLFKSSNKLNTTTKNYEAIILDNVNNKSFKLYINKKTIPIMGSNKYYFIFVYLKIDTLCIEDKIKLIYIPKNIKFSRVEIEFKLEMLYLIKKILIVRKDEITWLKLIFDKNINIEKNFKTYMDNFLDGKTNFPKLKMLIIQNLSHNKVLYVFDRIYNISPRLEYFDTENKYTIQETIDFEHTEYSRIRHMNLNLHSQIIGTCNFLNIIPVIFVNLECLIIYIEGILYSVQKEFMDNTSTKPIIEQMTTDTMFFKKLKIFSIEINSAYCKLEVDFFKQYNLAMTIFYSNLFLLGHQAKTIIIKNDNNIFLHLLNFNVKKSKATELIIQNSKCDISKLGEIIKNCFEAEMISSLTLYNTTIIKNKNESKSANKFKVKNFYYNNKDIVTGKYIKFSFEDKVIDYDLIEKNVNEILKSSGN